MPHRGAPGETAVMTTNTPLPGTYQIDPERTRITLGPVTLSGPDTFAVLQFDPTTVPEPGTLALLGPV